MSRYKFLNQTSCELEFHRVFNTFSVKAWCCEEMLQTFDQKRLEGILYIPTLMAVDLRHVVQRALPMKIVQLYFEHRLL